MTRRGAATLLVATAAVLPFELRATLPVGPLRLSSVELFLYATLALWCASRLGSPASRRELLDPRRWPGVLRAAAVLALVMLLSAVRAPELRGAALKFALRSLSGIGLAFAAADLLRAADTRARALTALILGGLVAAVAVLVEARAPAAAALWLRPFHEQTFETLGQVRGSGPFQFPNIAAMALEAAIPLALVRAPAGPVAALAMFFAVVATGSRAGLVGSMAATLAIAFIWIGRPPSRRAGWVLALSLPVLLAAGVAANGTLTTRLRFWREADWYRTTIAPAGGPGDRLPARLVPGAPATELIAVTNRGTLAWRPAPPWPVALSYHWVDADTGRIVERDGRRTPLPADLPAGASATLRAAIRAPARPGRYLLWWDMVQEEITWFSARGDAGWREPVLVGDVGPAPGPSAAVAKLDDPDVPRRQLWSAARAMFRAHALLGVGPDNFRHLYGRTLGLPVADDRLHANSLYFETLADLGLGGVLAWGALLVALARAARRALPQPAAAGVVVALGTFLLHGALDYFFAFTPTFVMFWLLVGALVALDPQTSEPRREPAA